MAQPWEIQVSLNVLAGKSAPNYVEAQVAANLYAGTTGLELIAALNSKAGTNGLDLNAVCNSLNSSTGREAQDALSMLAGGPHT